MMTALPRIAIPEPTSTDTAYNQRSLPQYIHAVMAAGGIAVPIPLHEARAGQKRLVDSCNGILLPGSPADVDPKRYGQEPRKETAERDALREAADDLLLSDAFERGKPLLGICFGLQSLSVFRHGSLIQHLPQSPDPVVVNHEPGREVQDAHPVVVAAGSRLAELVGDGVVQVNSSHHQAVDQPGESLKVVAISPDDGVVEALEGESSRSFLLAVQWHPERTYEHSAASRAIFGAFVAEARKWAPAAGS
jgi:putative glutamine amidotransferase